MKNVLKSNFHNQPKYQNKFILILKLSKTDQIVQKWASRADEIKYGGFPVSCHGKISIILEFLKKPRQSIISDPHNLDSNKKNNLWPTAH